MPSFLYLQRYFIPWSVLALVGVTIIYFVMGFQINFRLTPHTSNLLPVLKDRQDAADSQFSCYCHSRKNKTHECDFMLNRSVLIHQPPLNTRLQSSPCLLLDTWLTPQNQQRQSPTFSIILTVWNQELHINTTLINLLNHTRELWELIIVFDQCRDKSILFVNHILTIHSNPTLVHIRLIEQETGVAETSANNIGMRATHPSSIYFILVQDDLFMRVPGWNVLLSQPARLYSDVFSASARCGHSTWSSGRGSFIGRCGVDIDRPLSMTLSDRCQFYVRDTGNRGPLLLHASRTRQLGYLDEEHYWLGDDEHDLNFRAYVSHRWVAGFRPLDFDAPLAAGGTRRKIPVVQTEEEKEYRNIRTQKRHQNLGALEQFGSHQWESKDIHVILDFSDGPVNLRAAMMQLANSSTDLASTYDERRPLCGTIPSTPKSVV